MELAAESPGFIILKSKGLDNGYSSMNICTFILTKQTSPSLSLATIYNTLDVLIDLGFVNSLGSAGDEAIH